MAYHCRTAGSLAWPERLRLASPLWPPISCTGGSAVPRRSPFQYLYFSVAQTGRRRLGWTRIRSKAFDLYLDGLCAPPSGGQDAHQALSGIQGKCQSAMDKADAGVDADQ